ANRSYRTLADRAADAPDEDFEARRIPLVGVAPDDLEDVRPRDDPPVAPSEKHDEIELARREWNELACLRDAAPLAIDHEIAERASRLGEAGATTPERAHSREQLFDGERFAEVVVTARVEPGDAIRDAVSRGQDENRY